MVKTLYEIVKSMTLVHKITKKKIVVDTSVTYLSYDDDKFDVIYNNY